MAKKIRLSMSTSTRVLGILTPFAFVFASPAHADCNTSGSLTTCSGATTTGFASGDNQTVVTTTGSVTSNPTSDAINLGNNANVTNLGTIQTTIGSGDGVDIGSGAVINQAGAIISSANGRAVVFSTPAGATSSLMNMGTISAAAGNNAVFGGDGGESLTNLGTISGNIQLGAGVDQITNAGALNGNISLGSGSNNLTLTAGPSYSWIGSATAAPNPGDVNTIILNGTGTATLNNSFSGFANLVKNGPGTWTLNYTSASPAAWSGATTVNAGTLALQGGAAIPNTSDVTVNSGSTLQLIDNEQIGSLAGAGNVALGANTLGVGGGTANPTNFSGVMSGSGGLTLLSGNLTLSGANTYTGLTTINGGTLTLAGGNAIANPADVTLNGGTLAVANTETIGALTGASGTTISLASGANLLANSDNTSTSVASQLTGAGGFGLAGTGTLTLTNAANSYTGQTLVNAGLLAVQNGAIPNTSDVTVASGATLSITGDETVGSLAGPGTINATGNLSAGGSNATTITTGALSAASLTKVGTGTFTLSGPTTLSGALNVNAGGVAVDVGDTTNAGSAIVNAGSLTVNGTLNAPLTINSGGTASVSAGAGQSGGVTINQGGTFQLFGTEGAGAVTNAGTILGTGVFTGAVTNNGVLSPGPAGGLGTITINSGGYTQLAGGTFAAQIGASAAAGTYDRLIVNGGSASLAGSLAVSGPQAGSLVAGTAYPIISASGGVSGNFSSVTYNGAANGQISPFLAAVASASGTNELVTITRLSYAAGIGPLASPNRVAAANAFGAGASGATGDFASVIQALDNTSASDAANLFDQTSPEFYGAYASALNRQSALFAKQIDFEQSNEWIKDKLANSAWVRAYGDWQSAKNDGSLFGAKSDLDGIAGGGQIALSEQLALGLAAGWSQDSLTYRGSVAGGKSKSWQIGAYLTWLQGPISANAQVHYANGDLNSSRNITAATQTDVALGKFGGDTWRVSGDFGYAVDIGANFKARPFIGIDYASTKIDGFTETGASSLNLAVNTQNRDTVQGKVGVDVRGDWEGLQPFVRAAYLYDFDNANRTVTAALAGAPTIPFSVGTESQGQSTGALDAGLAYTMSSGPTLSLAYSGRFGKNGTASGITGAIAVKF